ncbi:DMT family transporter [Actinoalloteichus hymeniacidonis]|uniref:Transporter family-2 protein n=1 Tax=Actinoalloteichus hymeniacidonis TaxID=340345 RepID=A0AAC9MZQ9_9PSEU|nr:DMT family transporter [Actinoalloteichus hymeniacidonis]AOS65683.1 hypothetical protein TL08_24525 [Actinoalloteichus hymeniacidonis]MBB5906227.1 transporter family-2 protein [Actinoalloteichus hymeniacidonis]
MTQARNQPSAPVPPDALSGLAANPAAAVPALIAAVVSGSAVAVQSRINGELAQRVGSGFTAALISFGVGLVIIAVLVLVLPRSRRGVRRIVVALRAPESTDGPRLRPWQCLGGACGAFLVLSQGITVAAIGVSVFTVAVVGGQVASGLLVDRLGIGPGGARPVTALRLAGSVVAVLAVLVAVSDKLGDPRTLGLAVLPAMAGIGIAWQQAVNGRVSVAAGSAMPATLVNFAVGTVLLSVAFAISVLVVGPPEALPTEPWLYVGGAVGVLFIALGAVVVRRIGVLLLGLGSIAGQLIGAVLLDVFVPSAGSELAVSTLVGSGLTLVAVVLALLPGRRRA